MKVSISQHLGLRAALEDPTGFVGGDNGVRKALVRRGLAFWKGDDCYISKAGREAIAKGTLTVDQKTKPAWMTT